MAYKGFFHEYLTDAQYWAAFKAFMLAIGWEIHDAVSADNVVYKSNGESGTKPTCYIWASHAGTVIHIRAYLYWNAAAHTGSVYAAPSTDYASPMVAGQPGMMCGDKDLVCLMTSLYQSSTYYMCMFGQWPYSLHPAPTNTTGDVVAGSAVTIPVVSSANMGSASYVQIVGVNGEGRDKLLISSVPDATSIVVATLPRNYASGAYVGRMVTSAGSSFYTNSWCPLCHMEDVGAANHTAANYAMQPILPASQLDTYTNMKHLVPVYLYDASKGFLVAYAKVNGPLEGYDSTGDTLSVQNGIPLVGNVTDATSTTLSDSLKAWTTNALVGKFVIISNGPGIGNLRKITANTATEITVGYEWAVAQMPTMLSEYKIIDTAYRAGYASPIFRITDTGVPG